MRDNKRVSNELREKSKHLLSQIPLNLWHKSTCGYFDPPREPNCFAVACSGGADSIFALLITYALLGSKIKVLHLNHGLRGPDSDEDEELVFSVARAIGVEVLSSRCFDNIRDDEGTLRSARIDFYTSKMREHSIKYLIQGHNLDDVAETMLWRLARGAGEEGLCAPRPTSPQDQGRYLILRPFLNLSRGFIRETLKKHEIPFSIDQSNTSSRYLRNRLRGNTLQSWKSDSDRDVLKGVEASRDQLEEVSQALDHWAVEIEECNSFEKSIDLVVLKKLPRAMRRKIIVRWLRSKRLFPTTKTLNEVLDGLERGLSLKANLSPESSLSLNEKSIDIICSRKFPSPTWATHALPFVGRWSFPRTQTLKAEIREASAAEITRICSGGINQEVEAWINYASVIDGELFVRRRESGDLFQPLGSTGQKKLKDFMIDRKWSQIRKENCPIVVDRRGQILWVPGFPPAESAKLEASIARVIRLTYSGAAS